MKNNTQHSIYFKSKVIKTNAFIALFFLLFSFNVKAQVFWTEDFGIAPACTGAGGQGTLASSYTGINGAWTLLSTGTNDPAANKWFVSSTEAGMGVGNCSDGCGNTSTLTNRTLHIGADDGITPTDPGASYNSGGLCGVLFCVATNMQAESPTINCTGKSNITLNFNYIENGDSVYDYANLMYFDGTSWSLLVKPPQTPFGTCSPQGMWTAYSIALPASSSNNANVKIGFNWTNNDDGIGTDPSFAVDDVTLTSPPNTITTDSIPGPPPFCACSHLIIPFTSTGAFSAGNIYTAQLSDSSGNFTAPVNIGTKVSTTNIDTITVIIPCNTLAGAQYHIRVISSSPVVTGTDNGYDIIIHPNIIVRADSVTICKGNQAFLTAHGGTTYTWSAGATSLGDSIAQATTNTTTTYTVTGTTGSCSDTAVSKVTVDSVMIIIASSTTICPSQTATLFALSSMQNTTFNWSSGATSTGGDGSSATASPSSTTTYTVTGTSGICSDTALSTVTVDSILNISVNSPTICSGQVAYLTASGGSNYSWSAGATSTGDSTAQASPALTTTYTVSVATSECSGSAVSTVTVNQTPTIIVNSPTICEGSTANLTANGGTTYIWSTGETTGSILVTPPTTTTYTVIGTTGSCADTAVSTVTVDSVLTISVTSPQTCPNQPVTMTASSSMQGTTYSWSAGATSTGGDGSSAQTSPAPTTTTTYTVSGTSGSCSDDAVSTVTLNNITVTISGNTVINSCENTVLSAFPSDGSYSWGPNVSCSTCQSITVAPTSTQQYWVTYTSPENCSDSDTTTVVVTNIYSYFMPTGFSPNGDGLNDLIQVHGRGIASIHLRIFDRIGEKVFETTDIEKGWNGRLHGLPMNDNVFVYILDVTYCNDETVREQGNITLVK